MQWFKRWEAHLSTEETPKEELGQINDFNDLR